MLRVDMDDVQITFQKATGGQGIEITLEMPDDAFKQFLDIAKKRGKSVEEVVAEALRLEQLFSEYSDDAEKSFIIRDGDEFKELVAV